jgi:putative ABC transport system ATP-binding protein
VEEDGLCRRRPGALDKALALLTPAHDAPLQHGTPGSLEVTRLTAANTFLAVPGFMNRGARGAKLLQRVLASPLLAASPLPFKRRGVDARRPAGAKADQRPADAPPLVRSGQVAQTPRRRPPWPSPGGAAGLCHEHAASPCGATAPGHKTYRLGQHVIPALQGVDLNVMRGELLALTGPSGSGKSTILNLCGLIDAPTAARSCWVASRAGPGRDRRTLLRRDALGFVFQNFNLVPVMTVAENVDYPLFIAGVPAAERRDRRGRSNCAPWACTSTPRIGPMPCRAASASVWRWRVRWSSGPRLVIADEPTASLDSHTADQVLELMRERCHAEGAAFVIATHDSRLSQRCDRVLALLDGRLQ